jgi:hypothetical protein
MADCQPEQAVHRFRTPKWNKGLLTSKPIAEGCSQGEPQTVPIQFRQRRLSLKVGFRLPDLETAQPKNSLRAKLDSLCTAR